MSDNTRKYAGYRNEALQQRILHMLDAVGHDGLTSAEIEENFDPVTEAHHGDVSGALSMLHAGLRIARLTEKRKGCKVYVERDFLDNRPCEAQGYGDRLTKDEAARLIDQRGFMDYWFTVDTAGARFATDRTRAERYSKEFFRAARRMFGDSVDPR